MLDEKSMLNVEQDIIYKNHVSNGRERFVTPCHETLAFVESKQNMKKETTKTVLKLLLEQGFRLAVPIVVIVGDAVVVPRVSDVVVVVVIVAISAAVHHDAAISAKNSEERRSSSKTVTETPLISLEIYLLFLQERHFPIRKFCVAKDRTHLLFPP